MPAQAVTARRRDFFAACGVDPQRLDFVSLLPMREYLEQYSRVDIALDPFPYGGGTTTCDALWMGVPAITLAGETGVSRGGMSILSQIGLTELIASTPKQYISIAVGLADDVDCVTELRSNLRQRMSVSPLMDGRRFANEVENAYRGMWEERGM